VPRRPRSSTGAPPRRPRNHTETNELRVTLPVPAENINERKINDLSMALPGIAVTRLVLCVGACPPGTRDLDVDGREGKLPSDQTKGRQRVGKAVGAAALSTTRLDRVTARGNFPGAGSAIRTIASLPPLGWSPSRRVPSTSASPGRRAAAIRKGSPSEPTRGVVPAACLPVPVPVPDPTNAFDCRLPGLFGFLFDVIIVPQYGDWITVIVDRWRWG
jgi:hypothetical protein